MHMLNIKQSFTILDLDASFVICNSVQFERFVRGKNLDKPLHGRHRTNKHTLQSFAPYSTVQMQFLIACDEVHKCLLNKWMNNHILSTSYQCVHAPALRTQNLENGGGHMEP